MHMYYTIDSLLKKDRAIKGKVEKFRCGSKSCHGRLYNNVESTLIILTNFDSQASLMIYSTTANFKPRPELVVFTKKQ